jgi:uncharacterized membrane protein
MADVAISRALHVLAVVIWIGGVATITTIALPAVRGGELGANWLQAFEAIERRFAWQARVAVIVVGLTGFYMTTRLNLWDRFCSAQFWWMHAMAGLWLLFAVILFVLEPFVAGSRLRKWAQTAPQESFRWMQWGHWVLLALAVIVIFGAVAGSQGGWSAF